MERVSEHGMEAEPQTLPVPAENDAHAAPPPPPPPKLAPPPVPEAVSIAEKTQAIDRGWQALQPGDKVAGLTLMEQLQGESGSPIWTVWRAADSKGIEAAVYLLNSDVSAAEHDQFVAGAKRMLKLSRSKAVPGLLRSFGMSKDRRALIAEYLSVGRTTDIAALGWSLQRVISFVQSLCFNLDKLHKHGIVHGCLRPGNILLDDNLNPVITELGFVDVASSLDGDADNHHGYGAYTAPEILAGSKPTLEADVYSLGQILLFLLSGEHPRPLHKAIPSLRDYKVHPRGLIQIARKCTAGNPDARYHSMDELANELTQWSTRESVGIALKIRATSLPPKMKVTELSEVGETVDTDVGAPAFGMKPTTRWTVAGGGVGGCAAVAAVAYVLPMNPMLLTALSAVAAAFFATATLALPGSPRHRRYGFFVVATAAFLATYQFSPLTYTAQLGAQQRLHAANVSTRAEALRFLAANGYRKFSQLDLRGANLSYADLNFATLEGADLTNANLTGAMVQGLKLDGATVKGADIADVMAIDWNPASLNGFSEAKCNSGTLLPNGWTCHEHHPTKKGGAD